MTTGWLVCKPISHSTSFSFIIMLCKGITLFFFVLANYFSLSQSSCPSFCLTKLSLIKNRKQQRST